MGRLRMETGRMGILKMRKRKRENRNTMRIGTGRMGRLRM